MTVSGTFFERCTRVSSKHGQCVYTPCERSKPLEERREPLCVMRVSRTNHGLHYYWRSSCRSATNSLNIFGLIRVTDILVP